MSGFYAAADTFRSISADAFRLYGQQQITRARFDAMNAIGRDADGYIKPVRLFEPGSYYGDAYNQVAITSYTAAARSSAQEQFRLAAVRNQRDPEAFDAFVQGWIERQTAETPPELAGALKLDLAEIGGQFKASILAAQMQDRERQRKAVIESDAENVLRDMYGHATAGNAAGMAKSAADLESYAQSLEATRDYEGAMALRKQAAHVQRVGPVMGRASALWQSREDAAGGEGPLDGYLTLARMAESGGRADAKNPNSSATGLYQFIDDTWVDQIKKNHPDLAAGRSRDDILKLRGDTAIQHRVMRSFTQDNYEALRAAGITGIGRSELYLAHFLGADGAIAVLKASPDAPLPSITTAGGLGRAVSDAAIKANKPLQGAKTAGDLRRWAAGKMGETAAAATLEGRYGTGVDVLSALSADIIANPGKYGYGEVEARQIAGQVQGLGAVLSAAKAAQADTRKTDEQFDFGMAQLGLKNKIDRAIDNNEDPIALGGRVQAEAITLARQFKKDPDSLNNELQAYLNGKAAKTSKLAETVQDLVKTRAMGGRFPDTGLAKEAVDWLTRRRFGHDLSVFSGDDHGALEQTFVQTGLLPTYATRQLQNLRAFSDASDPAQVSAVENAVAFVERLTQGKGTAAAIEFLPDLVGKEDADRLIELMGQRGSSLIRHNERMTLAKANIGNWKAERWNQLGATEAERTKKITDLVSQEMQPGRLMSALSSAFSLGGDNAISQWLAPRVSDDFQKLVTRNAYANVPDYTSPETAVAAAKAEALKVSAYTTFLRRPGEDMTPKLRPYAMEAYWPADVANDDLVKATTAKLNELRVKDTSWAKEIGSILGAVAAAAQQPVVGSDILDKLATGDLPPIDRDLTELDVKKMVQTGLIELSVSRLPTAQTKPAYRVFFTHDDRYQPIPGLDAFQPSERPGAEVRAMEKGVGWSRRFADETGLKIPAVIPGMGAAVLDELHRQYNDWMGDPAARSKRLIDELSGNAAGTYDKLKGPSGPGVLERLHNMLGGQTPPDTLELPGGP